MAHHLAGMDKKKLGNVDRFIEECVAQHQLAGASFAALRKGVLVHEAHHGYQDIDHATLLSDDSIFRIYSMTKPIVAVAFMTLFEQGKVDLNDPVKLYIAAFSKRRLPGIYDKNSPTKLKRIESDMKIWHLLTHTSGLSYGWDASGESNAVDRMYHEAGCAWNRARGTAEADNISLEQWVDRLAALPLLFEPGTRWKYSLSIDVVGRLIEVISGKPLDVFLKETVFEPLRMRDTSFHVAQRDKDRLASLYAPSSAPHSLIPTKSKKQSGGLTKVSASVDHNFEESNRLLPGGAGLLSTLRDYKRFTLMLLRKGRAPDGKRILSRNTLRLMLRNHLPANGDVHGMAFDAWMAPKGIGFGLGFSVVLDAAQCSDGHASVLSAGTCSVFGGANTFFWIDAEDDLCVVFMSQLIFEDKLRFNLRSRIERLVYAAMADDEPPRRCLKSKM